MKKSVIIVKYLFCKLTVLAGKNGQSCQMRTGIDLQLVKHRLEAGFHLERSHYQDVIWIRPVIQQRF